MESKSSETAQLAADSPSAPILIHEKSLGNKIGRGSDARDIFDQQLLWLGSQCVLYLHALFQTARIHDQANAALNQSTESLLTILKTLAQDQPVAIRFHGGFLFLGEMHLKMSAKQITVFSKFMDSLSAWKIGAILFHQSIGSTDLREFAHLFVSLDPHTSSLEDFRKTMIERGVRSIELEELQSVGGGARTQIKALAKNYYVQGASAAQELDQTLREGRTISFKQAKRAIQNIVDLMQNDESILLGLTTLRCHDEYTHNHSVNVSILSIALGNRAGYPKADLSELGLAALFHDVGKSCIPLQVLNKPGEFSDEEWQLMRSHPIEGVLTMIALRGISNVPGRLAAASFEHHMNCNLSGYPKLSVPWNQSLTARVVTIADCYDAMTSSRVYRRQPMPPEKVLKIMLSKSGEAFDPVLLKLFINCVGIVPIGSLVLLDSHELAVVIRTNQTGAGDRPWVKLISDVQGDAIDGPEVNLADLDDQGRYRLSIQRLVDHTEYGINPSQFFV